MGLKPISIMQWDVEIGIFNISFYVRCKFNALRQLTPSLYTIAKISIKLSLMFLLLCGDVELNPGPTKNVTLGLIFPFFSGT